MGTSRSCCNRRPKKYATAEKPLHPSPTFCGEQIFHAPCGTAAGLRALCRLTTNNRIPGWSAALTSSLPFRAAPSPISMLDCPPHNHTSPTSTSRNSTCCGPSMTTVYGPPGTGGWNDTDQRPSLLGHRLHRVVRDGNTDRLAWLRPPPDGVGLSALENHVVAEHRADKRQFRAALNLGAKPFWSGWWAVRSARPAGTAKLTGRKAGGRAEPAWPAAVRP